MERVIRLMSHRFMNAIVIQVTTDQHATVSVSQYTYVDKNFQGNQTSVKMSYSFCRRILQA